MLSEQRKTIKAIKNVELRRKPFKTTQNYKSDQITMNCMDLTSKRTKNVEWTAKNYKSDQKCWVTSQTIQNNAKLQKRSNYDELVGFDVKTNKNVELRRKAFKTTQICKSNQMTINSIDLMSKRLKERKTTKVIKLRRIASIWRQDDQKCWVTSQTIQNTANQQKWSNYDELHRFDVKTIKTTQNTKHDQITINLRRSDVKTFKNF